MANETPDLSRIVNLILSNPKLIEEIQAMAKQEDTKNSAVSFEAPQDEASVQTSVGAEATSETAGSAPTAADEDSVAVAAEIKLHRETRSHLLTALKPYLSDNRRRAVDSMLQIADLLDVFKSAR